MMKVVSKSWILGVLVMLCVLVLVSGCGQTSGDQGKTDPGKTDQTGENTSPTGGITISENVGDLFHKVKLGQTKEEVDAALGVTPTSRIEGAFDYVDEKGNGVTVIFIARSLGDDSPKVAYSKRMIGTEKYLLETPDDQRITEEQAGKITEGMTYDEVKGILGQDGIVVSEMLGSGEAVSTERYFIKPGIASMLSVTFAGPGGNDVSTFVVNF